MSSSKPTAHGAEILSPNGSIELPDVLRELLRDEAVLVANNAGDAISHAKCSADVREAVPKAVLAARMLVAAETGKLAGPDVESAADLIEETRGDFIGDLAQTCENAQRYIVGNECGLRFCDDRAENVREYGRLMASHREMIARCEAFLGTVSRPSGPHNGRTIR